MIALVEGAERQKTPNEIALNILLAGLTIIFLLAVVTLQPFAIYSGAPQSVFVLVSLLVCLIPTTIGGLAVGDRHRRDGPAGAAQRAGDVGPRRRSRRRRAHAAARQDRHDHAREPSGDRVHPAARRDRAGDRRRRAALVAGGRNARRAIDRRAREGAVRAARTRPRRTRSRLRAVHRADPHVGRRPGRPPGPQGRRRRDRAVRRGKRRGVVSPELQADRRPDRARGRHAAGRRRTDAGARRRPPEGHRQGRHPGAVHPAARDGDQDRDDHRRQPVDRGVDCGGSGRRRLSGRGDAGRQDGADQERAAGRASSSR